MNHEASSEERLLKHLQKRDAAAQKAQKGISATALSAKKGKGSGADRLLVLVVLLMAGYGAGQYFLMGEKDINRTISGFSFSEPKLMVRSAATVKPFSEYLERYKERDIFNFTFQEQSEVPAPSLSVQQPVAVVNPTSSYKIVGIVLDDKKQVVILDAQKQETLFLYEGDAIDNMTVKEIKEGKVILEEGGQLYELNQ